MLFFFLNIFSFIVFLNIVKALYLFCVGFAALDCTIMNGNLKQIDAGSGSVVGVNDLNQAFVLQDDVFNPVSRSLKHFSVGPAGQLGVNKTYYIFKLMSGRFVGFPGIKSFSNDQKYIC